MADDLAVRKRLESDVGTIDAGTYGTSIAISLKRIADSLDKIQISLKLLQEDLNRKTLT